MTGVGYHGSNRCVSQNETTTNPQMLVHVVHLPGIHLGA